MPNRYLQSSNGGEFGIIILPFSPGENSGSVIAPIKDGQYVNKFGWAGDFVVGEMSEYGEKLVDPQFVQGYLMLDTASGLVTYFDSLEELKTTWQAVSSKPFPTQKPDMPQDVKYDFSLSHDENSYRARIHSWLSCHADGRAAECVFDSSG